MRILSPAFLVVLAIGLGCAALPARAARPVAVVEALQMPAWLSREGQRTALALGAVLRNGDEIETGSGARALLRLGDGSMVKLGETARFRLDGTGLARDDTPFKARLGVLAGAFRFTTTPQYRFTGKRDIEVRFPTVTARVTGTDLWGKAGIDREIVALIEGRISVSRSGGPALDLSQPKSLYQALANAGVLPVQTVSDATLTAFAAETEMQPGRGTLTKNGGWRVYAARTADQAAAHSVYERLLDAGFAAGIAPVSSDGGTIYQVRIAGLVSEADGVALAVRLRTELGLTNVSVAST